VKQLSQLHGRSADKLTALSFSAERTHLATHLKSKRDSESEQQRGVSTVVGAIKIISIQHGPLPNWAFNGSIIHTIGQRFKSNLLLIMAALSFLAGIFPPEVSAAPKLSVYIKVVFVRVNANWIRIL